MSLIDADIASALYGVTSAILQDKSLSVAEKEKMIVSLVRNVDAALTIRLNVSAVKPNGHCNSCRIGLAFDVPKHAQPFQVRCPSCGNVSNFKKASA